MIDDVEETILDKRRRLDILIRRRATERHRVGEVQRFNVLPVDLVERRETLAIIGAMIHQPVLRLLVGVYQPLEGDLRRERRGAGEHNRGKHEMRQ